MIKSIHILHGESVGLFTSRDLVTQIQSMAITVWIKNIILNNINYYINYIY